MRAKRTDEPQTLCSQLREAIHESGWTVYRIAKAAGVKHAVVSRFVAGERDLRLETASKIAGVLGLALHQPDAVLGAGWSHRKSSEVGSAVRQQGGQSDSTPTEAGA